LFRQIHRLFLFLVLLWALAPSSTQAQVINCPSGFSSSSSAACGVGIIYPISGYSFGVAGGPNGSSPGLSGSRVLLLPAGAEHAALSLIYQTQVNVQAFTAAFTFVPNGQNFSLLIQNSNNNPSFNGSVFSAGAGGEADFFQGYSQTNPPNNVFAMMFDSVYGTTDSTFNYSNVQIYQSNLPSSVWPNIYVQCPCQDAGCGTNNTDSSAPVIDRVSTSPVPLNSPATTQNTSTGDTYSATVTYDGSNLTLNLYDVTAGGSCPGSSCFTNTWTDIDIPASVDGSTAWVGFGGATGSGGGSSYPLYVNSFVYAEGAPTSTPAPTSKPAPTSTPAPTSAPTVTPTVKPTATPTPSPASVKKGHHKKWDPPSKA
jgi:hypothetical protein